MSHHKLLTCFIAVWTALSSGCKPSKPGEQIADPESYLRDKLIETPLKHWMEPYRNNAPGFVDPIVARIVESEQKRPGGLTHDSKKLDRLALGRLRSAYLLAMENSEEGRAHLHSMAQARLENPAMAMVPFKAVEYATLDYWVLPGKWLKFRRGYQMSPEGLASVSGGLNPEFYRKSLLLLSQKFPNAHCYDIRARVQDGSHSVAKRYLYFPASDVMYRDIGRIIQNEFSSEKIGGLEALLSGSVSIDRIDFDTPDPNKSSPGPAVKFPDQSEPLTAEVLRE